MNSATIWLYLKKKPVLLRTTNSQKEINKIETENLHTNVRKNLLKRYVFYIFLRKFYMFLRTFVHTFLRTFLRTFFT